MQKTCPLCKRFIKKEIVRHDHCYEKKNKEIEFRLENLGFSRDVTHIMATEIVFKFVYQNLDVNRIEGNLPVWDFELYFESLDLKKIEGKAIDFNRKLEEEAKKDIEKDNRDQKPKQVVMDMRGGAREGAGRKRKGTRKPVSINLPDEEWRKIQEKIDSGEVEGFSDYFVSLHLEGSHVHS